LVSVKLPFRSLRPAPANIIMPPSPLRGTAVIIEPSTGFPSDPITTPVIFARRTGSSAKSVFCASWPGASVSRCASAPFAVPGKYVGAYPEFGFEPVGPMGPITPAPPAPLAIEANAISIMPSPPPRRVALT
jgi:hypothetical protein